MRPASASLIEGAVMFRVSHRGDGIDDVDSIEGARQVVRGQPPGRVDVDEIRVDPFGAHKPTMGSDDPACRRAD
jgi:hypothetical protein